MLHVFESQTADEVWQFAVAKFDNGVSRQQNSRGGVTDEILHAFFTISDSRQRWVIQRQPPINPAFAIAEVVWIVNGRNDSAFLNYWNAQLPKYSGEGDSYYGAYGFRIRKHFGIDQLERAYRALESNPDGRQVVLQIWDAQNDLPDEYGRPRSKDIPCNVMSFLKIRDGQLEWMQMMRSNDLFRGTPYNFVQFTTLQEIMAGWLGIQPGTYNHLSDSLHLYIEDVHDIVSNPPNQAERNVDILSCSKNESDRFFALLNVSVEAMTKPGLTQDDLTILVKSSDVPDAYRNLLCVVGAECARRRLWPDLAQLFISECSNPVFVQLWTKWLGRFEHTN